MNTVFTNTNSFWRFPSSPKESNQSRKKTRVTAAQSQQKQEHSRIRGPTLCWLSLSRFLIIYNKDQGPTLQCAWAEWYCKVAMSLWKDGSLSLQARGHGALNSDSGRAPLWLTCCRCPLWFAFIPPVCLRFCLTFTFFLSFPFT